MRETGPQYKLQARRAGIPVAAVGILGYLEATSVNSPLLHAVSIAVFYWGSVLYLGGTRGFISTLPAGAIVVSLVFPSLFGTAGLLYLDEFAWVLLVGSTVILLLRRKGPAPPRCELCASFAEAGKAFCSSCGRVWGSLPAPPGRKLLGFAVFTLGMLVLLSITIPLLVANPAVSLETYTLGGTGSNTHFAPLPGWGVKSASTTVNGTSVEVYTLTNGRDSIEALVAQSGASSAAVTALNATRPDAVPDTSVPSDVSRAMSGYTLTTAKAKYVGLDGVFQVGVLTSSGISSTFVAVDLRQTSASFGLDHGSTLYSAAADLIGWASLSAGWTSTAGGVLSTFQLFSQGAYAVSFGGVGVILFTLARDDELEKVRRLESMQGIGAHESAVLEAFGTPAKPTKGAKLYDSALKANPWVLPGTFFASLDETVRRGLVEPTIEIQRGRPTLYWDRLV